MKITRSLAATALVAVGSAALLATPDASAQLMVRGRPVIPSAPFAGVKLLRWPTA